MKTTVEIPDNVFREAKMAAAKRGLSLKMFLAEALQEKLAGTRRSRQARWPVPPPMVDKSEMRRIQSTVDEEFSRVRAEDWR